VLSPCENIDYVVDREKDRSFNEDVLTVNWGSKNCFELVGIVIVFENVKI